MSSEDGVTVDTGEQSEPTVDYQIEELIERRTSELEQRIEELDSELEEVENFARISLGERRLKQNEANLSEFSDSLTSFAERTFSKMNALESRLEVQTLLLASLVDALEEADDVEIDVSEVQRYQDDQLVMSASPEKRLQEAIERLD
jgi:sugar-specific transcriptional regulator TrmB